MKPNHRRGRAIGALVAVALHLVLWWRWPGAPSPARSDPSAPRVAVRLLPAPAAAAEPTPPMLTQRLAAPVRPARRPDARTRREAEGTAVLPEPGSTPSPAPPEPVTAGAPASAPPIEPSLLDSDATRRAIRSATRGPLLAERAAAAGGEPARPNPQERLGQEVQRAARGDCLKGEYLGAGMGLLSVPFLAAAVLRDTCRH